MLSAVEHSSRCICEAPDLPWTIGVSAARVCSRAQMHMIVDDVGCSILGIEPEVYLVDVGELGANSFC